MSLGQTRPMLPVQEAVWDVLRSATMSACYTWLVCSSVAVISPC